MFRKYWRQFILTISAFFWSSCGDSESATQPVNPDIPPENGGANLPDPVPESSSSLDETLEVLSSSSEEIVRDASVITLYSNPSVTCEKTTTSTWLPVYAMARKAAGSCEEIQFLVKEGSAYTKEELEEMEADLENCKRYLCEPVTAYGVISQPTIIGSRTNVNVLYKCSNGESYSSNYSYLGVANAENPNFPRDENNILYLTEAEYKAAKSARKTGMKFAPKYGPELESSASTEMDQTSSSSLADECSSSGENIESGCSGETDQFGYDRMDFVQVDEIYKAVSKSLYAKYFDELTNGSPTEERRKFLSQWLDDDKSLINQDLLPEYDEYYDMTYESQCSLKGWLDDSIWFSGYIAKHQRLPDGTIEETERYREKFSAILNKLEEVIESKYKPKSDDSDMMS